MSVVVVGAGQIGFHLVKNLQMEGVPVSVIERDTTILRMLSRIDGIKIIEGNGQSIDELKKAGIENSSLFFASLPEDSQNILISFLAKKINPNITTVARIRDKKLLDADELYNINTLPIDYRINPEHSTAKQTLKFSEYKYTREFLNFKNNSIILRGIKAYKNSPITSLSLIQIRKKFPNLQFVIAAITKENETIIPKGATIVDENDTLYIFLKKEDEEKILSSLGYQKKKVKTAIVIGGGNYGREIASYLSSNKIKTRLIEIDRNKCRKLDQEFSKIIIINGDGSNRDVLKENDIRNCDLIVAATNDGFVNSVICSISKEMGAKESFCLTFNTAHYYLNYSLGADACLNPRTAAINKVIEKVYSKNIKSVRTIANEKAEIIEIQIDKTLPITDILLKDIPLNSGLLIGLIMRDNKEIIPSGNDKLLIGDKVFIFALKSEAHQILENFFKEKHE
ncbi:Trk system potassium transporter TrkA [bacterium]|nr:Trk system potassium transporter TrkA [bacterium]